MYEAFTDLKEHLRKQFEENESLKKQLADEQKRRIEVEKKLEQMELEYLTAGTLSVNFDDYHVTEEEHQEQVEAIDSEDIKKMHLTLPNLVKCVQHLIQKVKQVEDLDIVIVLGDTGSGKSTMLNSLVFGPKSLALKTIEVQSNQRILKQKVIDYSDEFKKQI